MPNTDGDIAEATAETIGESTAGSRPLKLGDRNPDRLNGESGPNGDANGDDGPADIVWA